MTEHSRLELQFVDRDIPHPAPPHPLSLHPNSENLRKIAGFNKNIHFSLIIRVLRVIAIDWRMTIAEITA